MSASCNTLLTRNRTPTVTASRKRLGRGAAEERAPSQQAGLQVGFQEGARWSPSPLAKGQPCHQVQAGRGAEKGGGRGRRWARWPGPWPSVVTTA